MSNIATNTTISLARSGSQKFMQRTLPLIVFAVVLAVIPFFGPPRTVYSLMNAMGV